MLKIFWLVSSQFILKVLDAVQFSFSRFQFLHATAGLIFYFLRFSWSASSLFQFCEVWLRPGVVFSLSRWLQFAGVSSLDLVSFRFWSVLEIVILLAIVYFLNGSPLPGRVFLVEFGTVLCCWFLFSSFSLLRFPSYWILHCLGFWTTVWFCSILVLIATPCFWPSFSIIRLFLPLVLGVLTVLHVVCIMYVLVSTDLELVSGLLWILSVVCCVLGVGGWIGAILGFLGLCLTHCFMQIS